MTRTYPKSLPQNRNRIPKSSTSDAASEGLAGEEALFREPEGYFKPEKAPTTAEYALLDGRVLQLGLVGESPLWVSSFADGFFFVDGVLVLYYVFHTYALFSYYSPFFGTFIRVCIHADSKPSR